jgi:hypothetical protein
MVDMRGSALIFAPIWRTHDINIVSAPFSEKDFRPDRSHIVDFSLIWRTHDINIVSAPVEKSCQRFVLESKNWRTHDIKIVSAPFSEKDFLPDRSDIVDFCLSSSVLQSKNWRTHDINIVSAPFSEKDFRPDSSQTMLMSRGRQFRGARHSWKTRGRTQRQKFTFLFNNPNLALFICRR